ncbi:MAG: hypothetical protein JST06_02325 [Bacteroidetes bacterium]|nr:hypothetical protein [Bacteroidota bacterium]MBS1629334.1 hypothetical protein [Bacteroidota bacterium]
MKYTNLILTVIAIALIGHLLVLTGISPIQRAYATPPVGNSNVMDVRIIGIGSGENYVPLKPAPGRLVNPAALPVVIVK